MGHQGALLCNGWGALRILLCPVRVALFRTKREPLRTIWGIYWRRLVHTP